MPVFHQIMEKNMARGEVCSPGTVCLTQSSIPPGSRVLVIARMPARAARAVLQEEEEALQGELVKFKLKPDCGWLLESLPVGKEGKKITLFLYK